MNLKIELKKVNNHQNLMLSLRVQNKQYFLIKMKNIKSILIIMIIINFKFEKIVNYKANKIKNVNNLYK